MPPGFALQKPKLLGIHSATKLLTANFGFRLLAHSARVHQIARSIASSSAWIFATVLASKPSSSPLIACT
ncbi:hypothetical protein C7413_107114 [Paraburkholderia silvatlantica]|nr:hypothetical protein C7411_107114 [Paraburkholderia silvatlantica]PXW38793.1 hypothetical protein C7413_107114 [Paraburkholderia silvatlantica]